MKKYLLTMGIAAAMLSAALPAQAARQSEDKSTGEQVLEAVVLYLPNRIIDVFDLFTINVGAGPIVEARLMATRAVDGGFGCGVAYKAYKTHHRQYGFGKEQGWWWSLVCIGEEDYGVVDGTNMIDRYTEFRTGFPTPDMRVYDFYTGPRDYWQIGGTLGGGITGDLYVHPVEWLDCALGFLFIDISADDLTFDDFR
ncbi:MAG: hypothetical protein PHI35_03840 [Victivallaceae bacterium]|nr:hypothetical protein [Victivallaceae bacterium]